MERYVLLVFTLLCIYVTFSYAEETREKSNSVPHVNSKSPIQCPDGLLCPSINTCCPTIIPGLYACCPYGPYAQCCCDFRTCCPPGFSCLTIQRKCVQMTHSSLLQVQAIQLVNSTDKRCHDGGAGMDPKVSRITPSKQVKTALKRSGFIGSSSDVFSPDEKYQCPDGTSICEVSSGIYGCCPVQNARRRP